MPLLGRPSRSYKNVDHNTEGLSAVGSAPYSSSRTSYSSSRKTDNGATEYTVKTYRPSYAELHFKRQVMHDPHPSSSFSPLPPAFQLGRKNKEQALAGQRAELDHILEPGFKTAASVYGEDDNTSVAGPSRLSSVRTAGGLSALTRRAKGGDDGLLRHSGSVTNFAHHPKSGEGGVARRALGGVYVDSTGRLHDTEYDPFAGVSEISRRKSRRRSAFGGQNRRGSCSSGSVSGSSDDSEVAAARPPRTSFDTRMSTEEDREREEIRKRLEVERRRLDEVSGYAAARRKSMMSDRASGIMANGRATPSIRSGYDDAQSVVTNGERNGTARAQSALSQHQHVPSPLTPTFEDDTPTQTSPVPATSPAPANQHPNGRPRTLSFASASSYNTGRISGRATSSAGGGDDSPRKHTETTPPEAERFMPVAEEKPPPAYKRDMSSEPTSPVNDVHRVIGPDVIVPARGSNKPLPEKKETITTIRSGRIGVKPSPIKKPTQTVERAADGATRITGFDAGPPRTPVQPASIASRTMMVVPESVMSHGSSRSSERDQLPYRQKPVERPREQVFPETPAQAKRREEKERRNLRAGRTAAGSRTFDSMTVTASARTRILPEIEIVEDDDPRIVFPANGHSTRVQSHDHRAHYNDVKRIDSSGPTRLIVDSVTGPGSIISRDRDRERERDRERFGYAYDNGSMRGSSVRSMSGDLNSSTHRVPSAIIEETGGGYLPSRWASGDRQLRVTEEQKERYRPSEWGGRKGDLAGRNEEWRPDPKDALKRNIKDMSTNARFSVFRAKKKILRKTDL